MFREIHTASGAHLHRASCLARRPRAPRSPWRTRCPWSLAPGRQRRPRRAPENCQMQIWPWRRRNAADDDDDDDDDNDVPDPDEQLTEALFGRDGAAERERTPDAADEEPVELDIDSPRARREQALSQFLPQPLAWAIAERSVDLSRWTRQPHILMLLGGCSLLFGFFSATSATTIIGSVADWDPLAAAIVLVWTEWVTNWYYSRQQRSPPLRFLQAFKIGLSYGLIVDALKLSG